MATVISVKFRNAARLYDFDSKGEAYSHGDMVIVETARGREMAKVVVGSREVPEEELAAPLKEVMRRATDEDIMRAEDFRAREPEAYRLCKEKAAKHCPEMKLVSAEYTYDGNKLLFYFTAEDRVDFRELVKDLASTFRTRIELRQIGVRDEAKIQGGVGICGRPLCCATYLPDFVPVSIKMAKEQNLSLNPQKISGICGRLMCCLKNEYETYECLNSTMPRVGDRVKVKATGSHGVVQDTNVLRQKVKVLVETDAENTELCEYEAGELEFRRRGKHAEAAENSAEAAELEKLEKLEEQEESERAANTEYGQENPRPREKREHRGRHENHSDNQGRREGHNNRGGHRHNNDKRGENTETGTEQNNRNSEHNSRNGEHNSHHGNHHRNNKNPRREGGAPATGREPEA